MKDKSGVLVASVVSGDPAERVGIQPNDIITEVDGKKVTTSRDLTNLAAKLGVGDTARVTVLRDGHQKDLNVKVGKRPLTMAAASDYEQKEKEGEYGFQVTELTPQVAQRYHIFARQTHERRIDGNSPGIM